MAKSPAGQSSAGALWPLVAIVVVAVFLIWLAMTSEPSTVATPMETPAETTGGGAASSAAVVQAAEFEGSEQSYVGREIELANVSVAQRMGPQIVWIELPSGAPFLVKMDSTLLATTPEVQAQARVSIVGRVLQKTDSVLNAWQQSGALQNEGHRAQAEFGATFIEASRIRPASGQ